MANPSAAHDIVNRERGTSADEFFDAQSYVPAFAPGRVNLLGEHTDYNDGFMLPIATPQGTTVSVGHNDQPTFEMYSATLGSSVTFRRDEAAPEGFGQYIEGCIRLLQERGEDIPSLRFHVNSNLPLGTGLSSSAALEVATLRAMRELLGFALDDRELALIAQQAEIQYAHVNCGVMDQMASSLADAEHMLFIDARTLETRLLPVPSGAELIVIDSGMPRTLAASAYNERRAECEAAAKALGVKALRDVTEVAQVEALAEPIRRRARHVVSENLRVLEACNGVSAERFGALMNDSHTSLRDDYEVSIPELDELCELLRAADGVYGARLTGAGFGGAVVALCRTGSAAKAGAGVVARFNAKGGRHASLLLPTYTHEDPMTDFMYPRPQLVRDNWTSLNGTWNFAFDDDHRYHLPTDDIEWTHQINVPFAPESKASGIGDTGFHKVVWYRREFDPGQGEGRVMLHFGAVDYSARVWVNNVLVVEHEGGHTPFSADVTNALRDGGPQVLTVQVIDDPADLAKPRGKQDWLLEPHSIWYPRTTGIWQTVWFERVSDTYIRGLRWTPYFDGFEIGCEILAAGDLEEDLMVEVKIWHGDQLLADDIYKLLGQEANRKIALSDPGIDDSRNEMLWSPERPTLLDAEVTLRYRGQLLDTVRSYTALRSVNINRDRFMLNGRPYPLRLVLDQGYWPDTLMTAPNDDALRRDVELAKAMGFNGVRKHQKIEDPRYLYWADKLGLLVWEEMPSAYRFSSRAITRIVREWTEAIERDYSHPCVIVWVPFNESWGVPNLTSTQAHRNAVEALYHLTRTLDATRPVIGNDGWEASATDILGIHDYDCDPEKLRARYEVADPVRTLFDQRRPGGRILTLDGFPHRGQPIVLTEFGGIAFDKSSTAEHTWGYSRANSEEAFSELYSRLLKVVNETFMFSGFCYTQFADTFQEANGLLCADRTPKIPIEQIRAATRGTRIDDTRI